jgi:hypothetical protein
MREHRRDRENWLMGAIRYVIEKPCSLSPYVFTPSFNTMLSSIGHRRWKRNAALQSFDYLKLCQ